MLFELLREGSRTAGAATVMLALACVSTGSVGFMLSINGHRPDQARSALRLSRVLAMVGGSVGLLGSLAAIPYHYLLGEVAARPALLAELLLLGVLAVWAVLLGALLLRGARQSDRR